MNANKTLGRQVQAIPVVGPALARTVIAVRDGRFPGSAQYWEQRYARGGGSGEGSRGMLAESKAKVLNRLVAEQRFESVIEFGCGDGDQLALADYPRYLGLDVSPTTLRRTIARFTDDPSKSFALYDPECFADRAGLVTADLALSLDVIYHLVEDHVYELHLRHVFAAARRQVVLFTSDADDPCVAGTFAPHVRHRPVARDVAERFPEWRLRERIENPHAYRKVGPSGSFADYFVYEPDGASAETARSDGEQVRR
ncbi:methyltransferase domain-containing protein [Glycomyces buryatensis]|uniref:Class I SAM-dependent methyltransferase n=1 Tax=Glycomyces buryatensis TaxID=2570927 RepID=A0A4S8PQX4_9ACTN|nr:methyltransferase domain-containing protein [Glycomyces buryatensis]THV33593.1 class I SAM-dependent methyltransferase [Glycomyces buryatensis]